MALAQDIIDAFVDNYSSKEDIEAFNQSLTAADKKTIEMIKNIEEISSTMRR